MASDDGGTRGKGDGNKRVTDLVTETDVGTNLNEDSNTHYLLVDLPGYKKEQVKLQILNIGSINISEESVIIINQRKRTDGIEQTNKVPQAENSDISKATEYLDGEILIAAKPKKSAGDKKGDPKKEVAAEDQNNNNIEQKPNDGNSMRILEENLKKWVDDHGGDRLKNTIKRLSQNSGIMLSAVISFALGLLLSRRFKL